MAGPGVEDMDRAVLAAALRQDGGDQATVGRRLIPVEGRRTARIELVRVEHDTRLVRVELAIESHQHRLLALRIGMHGEDRRAARFDAGPAARGALDQGGDSVVQRSTIGQSCQVIRSALIFVGGPCGNARAAAILQPAIGIGHGGAVERVGYVVDRGGRSLRLIGAARRQQKNAEHRLGAGWRGMSSLAAGVEYAGHPGNLVAEPSQACQALLEAKRAGDGSPARSNNIPCRLLRRYRRSGFRPSPFSGPDRACRGTRWC